MNQTIQKGYKTFALEGLQLEASLGILPEEINQPQPIEVNAELNLGEQPLLPKDDAIDQVLDYRRVRDAIIKTCSTTHVNLLETLAGQVVLALMALPGVKGARVCITKLEIFDDCVITVQLEAGEW